MVVRCDSQSVSAVIPTFYSYDVPELREASVRNLSGRWGTRVFCVVELSRAHLPSRTTYRGGKAFETWYSGTGDSGFGLCNMTSEFRVIFQ